MPRKQEFRDVTETSVNVPRPSVSIILIGDSKSGKTSLAAAFDGKPFVHNRQTTIGVDIVVKIINLYATGAKVTLWDTGGMERFDSLSPSFYRHADGAAVVFDGSVDKALENSVRWIDNFRAHATNPILPVWLVAAKCDRLTTVQIDGLHARMENFADYNGVDRCFATSCIPSALELRDADLSSASNAFERMASRCFDTAAVESVVGTTVTDRTVVTDEYSCCS